MTQSAEMTEFEKQMTGEHLDVEVSLSELRAETDAADRQCLKEAPAIKAKQQGIADIQEDDQNERLRRSDCTRNPTEKMRELKEDEAKKKEKRLLSMYEQWKPQVHKAIDKLKKSKGDITNIYDQIRDLITPSTDKRRRVNTCESVTTEIISIAYDRAVDDIGDFNEERERQHLSELRQHDYVSSVYGSAASLKSCSISEHHTMTSSIAADISSLAQALQDSITLNRLPIPEPFVFNGDPIRFIEWKSSFTSLIDQRAIT